MTTIDLFEDIVVSVPTTEGIKYAGSKSKMLPHILQLARKTKAKSVLDGFSGTTRVSQALAKSGYSVISNDIAIWSEVFGRCYLQSVGKPEGYAKLIGHLNGVAPIDGWFTANYGGYANEGRAVQTDGRKRPWQIHNTRKLDGIRSEIARLNLNKNEESVALTSLILALDKVDNTMGHFVSYLDKWSPRSYGKMLLEVPAIFQSDNEHIVERGDVFNLLSHRRADLAYFDPPYGSNNELMPPSRVRYASYYHPWTTICLNDHPSLFGKVARRCDSSDRVAASVFEEFRRDDAGHLICVQAIARLLHEVQCEWIILSYSSGGRATAEQLQAAISDAGELIELVEVDYRRNVMASMRWTHEWTRAVETPHREFLFLIRK